MSRVLVVGWFSLDDVVATVGDEAAAGTVSRWLTDAGVDHRVAWARWTGRDATIDRFDPTAFSDLVWVCGPLLPTPSVCDLLQRFEHARRWAVGVSVVDREFAGRFDRVIARDGDGPSRPDLAAAASITASDLVVAVVLAPHQPEYGPGGRHATVRDAVGSWVASRGHGRLDVATDMLTDDGHPRTVAQVVATLQRTDVVVTSRLHGLVLGRAAGRPVVAVDPVPGGAKVTAQAAALGWPVVLGADEVDAVTLDRAVERALRR